MAFKHRFMLCNTCATTDSSKPQTWAQTLACKCIYLVNAKPENVIPELDELWGADPRCDHDIKAQPRGGVKCTKCGGWFCF